MEPLLRVILDPAKRDVSTTALIALVRIGQPSVDRAALLLDSTDPLATFAKEAFRAATGAKDLPAENPSVAIAAAIIGMCGRAEGSSVLIGALDGELDSTERALIARELPKLPMSLANQNAFEKAFGATPPGLKVLGAGAAARLAEDAAQFYDSSLVDWLLERAKTTKAAGEDRAALQEALITAALKLATQSQWKRVDAVAKARGLSQLAKLAETPMLLCKDDVSCYVREVQNPDYSSPKAQFSGIKAAYMIGVLGDEGARNALVDVLSQINNDAIHVASLGAIDHLTPRAAPAVVEKLEAMLAANERSGAPEKLSQNTPLKQVIYRLKAR